MEFVSELMLLEVVGVINTPMNSHNQSRTRRPVEWRVWAGDSRRTGGSGRRDAPLPGADWLLTRRSGKRSTHVSLMHSDMATLHQEQLQREEG